MKYRVRFLSDSIGSTIVTMKTCREVFSAVARLRIDPFRVLNRGLDRPIVHVRYGYVRLLLRYGYVRDASTEKFNRPSEIKCSA